MKDSKLIFGAKIRSLILKRINLTNNDSFTRKLKLNFVKILNLKKLLILRKMLNFVIKCKILEKIL